MVNHSYECSDGHQFDQIVEWDQRYAKCECGKRAERSWETKRVRRFAEPVVLHRYSDGTYGVPGIANGPTPAGAERIECWHMADYTRHLGAMNANERSKAQRRHDAGEAMRDEQMSAIRKETIYRMERAGSAWERDMLKETLRRGENTYRPLQHQLLYNEALEYDQRRD